MGSNVDFKLVIFFDFYELQAVFTGTSCKKNELQDSSDN